VPFLALAVGLVVAMGATLVSPGAGADVALSDQTLDGSGNNRNHPDAGKANTPYLRVAPARYADGKSQPVSGPNSRFISNRIFNDAHQNIFSERRMSQVTWLWGQFIDHNVGLKDGNGPVANIPYNNGTPDPIETFTNNLGVLPFQRAAAAPGTGVTNTRQQTNTVSSFIDGWAVYGGTPQRLDYLRAGGPLDGNPDNNSAKMAVDAQNNLPRRDFRGNASAAPVMDADGRLAATPGKAALAGDVRANENIGLESIQTLFVREHNRIVNALPNTISEQLKFAIARRIVISEEQFITYTEFLPALGVSLPAYQGYNPNINPAISNEFATVAYRAHSMIHGEVEADVEADQVDEAFLESQGVEVLPGEEAGELELVIPANVMFFNPNLMSAIGIGPILAGLAGESQYKNDEQIDNSMRSVLFQVPVSGNPECLDGPTLPECFNGVQDVGALDVERGRDHGMPTYNQLRQAEGLAAKTSFTAITGEATENFPLFDPLLTRGNEINDPNSLDFVQLKDINGNNIPLDDPEANETATVGIRRTTLAARLKAIYGNVNNVDAFVGLVSERHVTGSELGELQRRVFTQQFIQLREGDRFFYQNNPDLTTIRLIFGIDFRRRLSQIITDNTELNPGDIATNVFFAPAA
jgi:hypothetical protein